MRALNERKTKLVTRIAEDIPGFTLRAKEDHPLWDALAKIMFWNPGISTRFITTLYPVVWVPSLPWQEDNPSSALEVLSHEYVHLRDRKKLGWLFNLLYLSPQIFCLFSLLAIINPWYSLCLLFLLPWPSPGRAWLEYRGYRMSMAVHYWIHGCCIDLDWLVGQFVGSNYYWMWPFRSFLIRRYEKEYEKIANGDLTSDLKDVKSILEL